VIRFLAVVIAVLLAVPGVCQANIDAESAYLVKGAVLVPMRVLFEWLGSEVRYEKGVITATGQNRTVVLRPGNTKASVDGRDVLLSSAPKTIGDSTYVPLRFVSEALGASVAWDASVREVTVTHRDRVAKLRAQEWDIIQAVLLGDKASVTDFLKQRSSLKLKNEIGNTALHEAAASGNGDLVGLLLRAGAEVNAKNRYGLSPLDLARNPTLCVYPTSDLSKRSTDGHMHWLRSSDVKHYLAIEGVLLRNGAKAYVVKDSATLRAFADVEGMVVNLISVTDPSKSEQAGFSDSE
jgi:hypothetical protein